MAVAEPLVVCVLVAGDAGGGDIAHWGPFDLLVVALARYYLLR